MIAPVTRPTTAASRNRWAPTSAPAGTLCTIAIAVATPATIHAASGLEPSTPVATRMPPPRIAPTIWIRSVHATSPRARAGSPRPSASATDRVSAIPRPAVRTMWTVMPANAMKLWRPNSSGPSTRAAAIEISSV